MKWPWSTREVRSGYESLLVAGIEATAGGTAHNVVRTGAMEIAAGMWGRVLAAAVVTGTGALTSRVRHHMGRHLIRHGEAVYAIETKGGLSLTPVSRFEVLSGWRYRCEMPKPPNHVTTRILPRAAVCHIQWAQDANRPWESVPPLASGLGTLAAASEEKLIEELRTPVAHILPIPVDGGDAGLDGLRGDIGSAKGGAVLAEATSAGWGEGPGAGSRNDWRAERLGPAVQLEARLLHGDTLDATLAACGIPPSLVRGLSDGTRAREDYRRWVLASVIPIANMIAEAASEALDSEVSLDFRAIWAHDMAGRSKAYATLIQAGVSPERAVVIAGLS